MISIPLVCPACGYRLTVSEFAPPQLPCPRWRAKIANPGTQAVPHSNFVTPVEAETKAGLTISAIAMTTLIAALVLGSALPAMLRWGSVGNRPQLTIVL